MEPLRLIKHPIDQILRDGVIGQVEEADILQREAQLHGELPERSRTSGEIGTDLRIGMPSRVLSILKSVFGSSTAA